MVELTLPSQLRDRALRVPLSERHPGLQLDKYSAPSDQEGQREPLLEVCGAARSPELLAQLAHRRRAARDASPGRREVFNASTVSPLTLHLARTSAPVDRVVQSLIDAANGAGGRDNVTVVLARF